MWSNQPEIRVFSGFCPDEACQTKLFFPSYAASSIECTGCGKHFHKEALTSVQLIQDSEEAIRSLLRSVLLTGTALKKGTDLVKVKGYSNYHCRILSPILTYYGMDKSTSKAKLLQEMGQGEAFDCAHVGDRAFSIEPEYLETPGYGKDKSGSTNYLHGLLEEIKLVNDNEERLVSLHVDGDGHCLVHAISRALIGREIFWHALMTNLQKHLKDNICKYRTLFMDFIGREEWDLIISEAGPDFEPQDDQPLGLRNIHIFGLANVLHRPILLLDSVSGIQSSADYSGTFLPALVPVDLCKTKDGKRIPPLAIAWSNSGRNHYIPLVNVRNKPAARVPSWVIPKAWGIPNELVKAYIDFETTDVCVIGGTKSMSDAYLDRLLTAMDEKFLEINHISASLVTEVHQFVFKPSGVVGVRPKTVIDRTRQTVEASLLLRCLSCTAVSEYLCPVDLGWLVPGGRMYVSASQVQGRLSVGEMYSFPEHSVVCTYNADNDVLEVTKYKGADVTECVLCKGSLRNVKPDGSLIYRNGDRTTTPVSGIARCLCGYKHFWDGKEYNNQPEIFPVSLDWGGTAIKENVYWFQYETDPSLNSNVYAVAQKLVQKYYPGEFGSERLVQKVVDTILRQTAKKEGENKGAHPDIPNLGASSSNAEDSAVNLFIPSKIILTGQKKKTFHKEELTKSDAERRVQIKTEHNAQLTQNRQSRRQKTPEKSPAKTQVTKPEPSPSSPRPTTAPAPRNNKRIRLSSSSGGQHDLTLPLNVTYTQLQQAIENALGVPSKEQKIRYGFPPRLLHPPEEGKEEEPISIQDGDKVMVEVLPPPKPEPAPKENWDIPEEKKMDVAGAVGEEDRLSAEETSKEKKTEDSPMDVDVDTSALASALMSALTSAMPNDMWEMACRSPDMFDNGGYYYNLAFNSLGNLAHDQHCTLPNLPNKVFAYNKDKDRLDLCLGKVHVRVQPITQETLATGQRTPHPSSSVINTEASFSGAITNRNSSRMAFTGEGRSMLDSSSVSPRQPEKQQTSSTSTTTETAVITPSLQTAAPDKGSSETTVSANENQVSDQYVGERADTEMANEQEVDIVAMETTQAGSEQKPLDPKEQSQQTFGTADVTMEGSTHARVNEGPAMSEESHKDVGPDSMEVETGFPRDEIPNQATEVTTETKDATTGNPSSDSFHEDTGFPRDEIPNQATEASTETKDATTGNPSSDSFHEDTGIPRDETTETKDATTGNPSLDSFHEDTGIPRDETTETKDDTTGNPSPDLCTKENNLEEKEATEEGVNTPNDPSISKETDQSAVTIATSDESELLNDESSLCKSNETVTIATPEMT